MATATADQSSQVLLSSGQVKAFYHELFVAEQVADFQELIPPLFDPEGVIVDVGGGQGYFAEALRDRLRVNVRVLDLDPVSVQGCRARGLDAGVADALQPPIAGDEAVACFNLILHHLVARGDAGTRSLQSGALEAWRGSVPLVFVNEYIYESVLDDLSGRLIFELTRSRILSAACRWVAKVVPSLRANTFGVGVRFRSHRSWVSMFNDCGYEVIGVRVGVPEKVALPLRVLLIRQIRRDSFLLRARAGRGS